jgi:D-methionine transport system substrate-binding protein
MRQLFSTIFLSLALFACKPNSKHDLVIGTISGPETDLVKVAAEVAKENYGLNIKIVEFADYNLPNEALADRSLDLNIYQHLPFLKTSMRAKAYPFKIVGKTFIYPMAIYSNRYHHLQDLPEGATIAVPNDPSNQTRALILLQSAGLITCIQKDSVNLHDILGNHKQFKFKELDAAQLPRVLLDVDAAVINTSFAIPAGLNPQHDGLFIETKDSPYANLIVARNNNSKDKSKKIDQFINAIHQQKVIDKALELFGNAAIPAWSN